MESKIWHKLTYLQNRNRLTDIDNRLVVAKGVGKKMWYIYTVEYYSAIKKNEIMPFIATWTQLEMIILSEVSQKEKDKYCMISLLCGI